MEDVEELKRSLRTAKRSIEAAQISSPVESSEHIAAAIQQLTFAVDKLIDLIMRAKAGQN